MKKTLVFSVAIATMLASSGCAEYVKFTEKMVLGDETDYSKCEYLEQKANDSTLSMSQREQALLDLDKCRKEQKNKQNKKKK